MEDIKTEGGRGGAYLDHNHTHFLLVDDGSEGKFGVEIKFRSKLESYISQKVETGVTETQSMFADFLQHFFCFELVGAHESYWCVCVCVCVCV